jgi:hypothetical protein
MYKHENLHRRTMPISVPHNSKVLTAQEKYITEICEIAKVYVKELLSLKGA